MKNIWLMIACILATSILITGCIGINASPKTKGKLVLISKDMTKEESGEVTVRVTVKNVGTGINELATVTVYFYDAQKIFISSSSDSVMNLLPGETWDFKITCQGTRCSEVQSCDVETTSVTKTGGF